MKNITYINAGAGSGKTYRLTEKLVELIKEGVRPEQVILTTFTTKAACEFKEKAKEKLYAHGLFHEAIRLDQAMIGTVHSVCQRFISKYWFNLGLSPYMNVMAEEDTRFYLAQSLAELPTDDELNLLHKYCKFFDIREYKDFIPRNLNYDFWQVHLKQIIEFTTNYEIQDYVRSEQESLSFIKQFVVESYSIEITEKDVNQMLEEARLYVKNSNRIKDKQEYLKVFDEIYLSSNDKDIAWYTMVSKKLKVTYGPTCAKVLEQVGNVWRSPEIYKLQEEYIHTIFQLAQRWKDYFAQFKREKNLLDYSDMEKYMRMIMQDSTISNEIQKEYRYLFVDEFQDSSPIQIKIFDALSDLMEHSFWVGDYKQAIYRFRGSDIELVKAIVDRITKQMDGCDTDTLDTSHRSLPEIVEINNDVFTRSFSNVLEYKNIHLKQNRKATKEKTSLRYFYADDTNGIAIHIAKLLTEGVKPNDIAVLARTNITLEKIASSLKEMTIPSSREDMSIIESPVFLLLCSLLQILNSNHDTLAKANVAMLIEKDFSTKRVIEEKILHNANNREDKDFLSEIPLIANLLKIKPELLQQSIGSMIESLIIELNLYNIIKSIVEPSFGFSCLQTIINTAYSYEQHCVQMNLPATIDGLIAYIEEIAPKGIGDANGVQLHTYHSSKGLQWEYVILTSLNSHPADEKRAVSNEIYGVHFDHLVEPSSINPYPEVFIRLTPWIYGNSRNVLEQVSKLIMQTDVYKRFYEASIAESNRVLYVGMTRARDVLLLHIEKPQRGIKLLQWFKDIGLSAAGTIKETTEGWDVLGVGRKFHNFTITQQELDNLSTFDNTDYFLHMQRTLVKNDKVNLLQKYISPSQLHDKGKILSHHNFNMRIPFDSPPSDMAILGDCIHQIFAGIEEMPNIINIEKIIKNYNLEQTLVDTQSIINAWNNLVNWLSTQYGPAIRTYHERPFRLERNGQIIIGSIDLVWENKDGMILIDFKSNPMGEEVILNETSEHYAGWHSGQLNAYSEAMEAAGERILKRFIYYPVSGIITEINSCSNNNLSDMEITTFEFENKNIDLKKIMNSVIEDVSDEVICLLKDVVDEDLENRTYLIEGKSTQGINLKTRISGKTIVTIPYLASKEDITFAFKLLRAIQNKNKDLIIYKNDKETIADLSEEYEQMIYMSRLENMERTLLQANEHVSVFGIENEFHIHKDYLAETIPYTTDTSEIVLKLYEEFAKIQWIYQEYSYLDKAEITTPNGEEYIARILTNQKGFIRTCKKIIAYNKKDFKIVDVDTFLFLSKGNKYIHRMDYKQFAIDKMPNKEWKDFYDSLPKEDIIRPKTYILRWNPLISSFKLEDYISTCKKYPNGWGTNWSIHEYKEAKINDQFFMLRVGDDNGGIMFRGYFSSEPYIGNDWAGTGKKRHYVDIDCYDPADANGLPHITIEELETAIPEINWRKGHSGQLLTKEQEETLIALWESKNIENIDNNSEYENNQTLDNVFDPEMGHGAHNQCIDNDITFVLNNIPGFIAKSDITDSCENITINLDGKEYNTTLLYASTIGKDLIYRSIINVNCKGNELYSFFPYAINNEAISLKIKHIYEYSNKIEAILVCEYKNSGCTFKFFDINYAKNKDKYIIGESYNFALSAMAYNVEIIPKEEHTFIVNEDFIIKIQAEASDKLLDSEHFDGLTNTFNIGNLVYLLQLDEKYPDDAEFCSPIMSRVKKVSLMNRDFYKMTISIHRDELEDTIITIPIIARTDFFERKPSKNELMRGNLWLQGRMIE